MKIIDIRLAVAALAISLHPGPAAAAAAKKPDCTPLKGAETLIARTNLDYVIVGEPHGTQELPALFGELVCAFAADGKPLVIGLEFLSGEQPSFDAYLASDGGDKARKTLLASEGWADQFGRASQAIFELIASLRRLKSAGTDLTVVAFDHPSEVPGTSDAREKGMAQKLIDAKAARKNARKPVRVIALTGVGHAGKSAWTSFNPPFLAMSQHLPADRTVAVTYARGGGEIWACRAPAAGAPEECKTWPSTARDPISERGLILDTSREGFDAIVSAGKPFSASPPARSVR